MRTLLLVLLTYLSSALALGAESANSAKLQSARERWEASAQVSYSFTIQEYCFLCSEAKRGPARISIAGAKVSKATYVGVSREGFIKGRRFRSKDPVLLSSVPQLFQFIEMLIVNWKEDEVSLEFDPIDGHPTFIGYGSNEISDDGSYYRLTDFQRHDR